MSVSNRTTGEKRKQDNESLDANKRARIGDQQQNFPSGISRTVPITTDISKFRTNPEFLVALIHTRVEALRLPENKVFVADRSDKIVDVWKGLVRHNFLSVPVLRNLSNPSDRKWWGFVDVSDLVNYVVNHFPHDHLAKENNNFWDMVKADDEFQKKTVDEVMQFPGFGRYGNLFHPVKGGYSLFYAIESLAKERDLHRLVVINDEGVILNFVTQSHLVEFLAKNMNNIGEKLNLTVGEFYNQGVFSVKEDDMAIEAFKLMNANKISGVAIVDGEGKLKGNISNRDLKAISTDGSLFWRLFSTAKNFRIHARKDADPAPPRGTVTVTTQDTLRTVITKLNEDKIHRVYVIDHDRHPLGVISLRDVLLQIIT